MNTLLGLAGTTLIAVTMLDVLWTTLSTTGGGPLSSGLARKFWQLALKLHDGFESSSARHLLQVAGPGILLALLLLWIVLLWSGWTLLFSAAPDAVRAAQTGVPADLVGRIYFTGYTLFTLGIGNYVPKPGGWEIATAVASLNGLFLITLSITYLVSLLAAATRKYQLAAVIAGLGRTPHDIVRRAWTSKGFASFRTQVAQLVPMIEMHTRSHLAYPALHYFHSPDRRAAVSLQLATLDDALLLMAHGLAADARPAEATLAPAREAIGDLLSTLHRAYLRPATAPPAPPPLQPLTEMGLPVTHDATEYHRTADAHALRRRLMRAYVENEGWTWSHIEEAASAKEIRSG